MLANLFLLIIVFPIFLLMVGLVLDLLLIGLPLAVVFNKKGYPWWPAFIFFRRNKILCEITHLNINIASYFAPFFSLYEPLSLSFGYSKRAASLITWAPVFISFLGMVLLWPIAFKDLFDTFLHLPEKSSGGSFLHDSPLYSAILILFPCYLSYLPFLILAFSKVTQSPGGEDTKEALPFDDGTTTKEKTP
jgi:hypothetical protein